MTAYVGPSCVCFTEAQAISLCALLCVSIVAQVVSMIWRYRQTKKWKRK